jgi:hypothetical protein
MEEDSPITSDYLDMVFHLDPTAWSPRKLVYRDAVEFAESTGSRIPSPTDVYAALRARRFREAKRRGVWGFVGIRTYGPADEPRVKPAGTASAYFHRHERTYEAREAMYTTRQFNKLANSMPGPTDPSFTPWFEKRWTADELRDYMEKRTLRGLRSPGAYDRYLRGKERTTRIRAADKEQLEAMGSDE